MVFSISLFCCAVCVGFGVNPSLIANFQNKAKNKEAKRKADSSEEWVPDSSDEECLSGEFCSIYFPIVYDIMEHRSISEAQLSRQF